jgi:hypothetical protein
VTTLPALFAAVAAPIAAEFLLASTAAEALLSPYYNWEEPRLLAALAGILIFPAAGAYFFARLGRAPAGAGWWILLLNFFAVSGTFLYSMRLVPLDF